VLDLVEPQSYQISTTQISTTQNAIVVKLSPVKPGPVTAAGAKVPNLSAAAGPRLQSASLAVGTNVAITRVATAAVSNMPPPRPAVSEAPPLPKPPVTVTFVNGMLSIRTEKATLAQVLFEVQRQTQAEIAIPAGAEQEEVAADLGPAPSRDVLGSLLNGSLYNFIFVGDELSLERVILTRRDASAF
jgi:hypothetical protein